MRYSFKVLLTLTLITLVAVFSVYGRGVQQGTIITNAKPGNLDNTADLPGEVVANFTNSGGSTNYARATNITVSTVAAAYDLSVINTPSDQTNGPGSYVEYDYYITNWANLSAPVVVRVSSNNASPTWGASSYEIWTNMGSGWGLLAGPSASPSNTTASIAPDGDFIIRVRVNIPATAADGATNEFFIEIWDQAWTGAAGDQWPGAGAIAPATPDLADARDYQSDYVVTYCAGPVIQLSKTVDITSAKPYEVLTYTIHYTNSGSGNAYNVTVDDVLYTNYVRILADSAETNNTVTHNPTNFYFDGTTWQPATFDNGNENSVSRIRWQLRNAVAPGESGNLEFKVRIE